MTLKQSLYFHNKVTKLANTKVEIPEEESLLDLLRNMVVAPIILGRFAIIYFASLQEYKYNAFIDEMNDED